MNPAEPLITWLPAVLAAGLAEMGRQAVLMGTWGSLALVVCLVLRAVTRGSLQAGSRYLMWVMVPCAMVAAGLPRPAGVDAAEAAASPARVTADGQSLAMPALRGRGGLAAPDPDLASWRSQAEPAQAARPVSGLKVPQPAGRWAVLLGLGWVAGVLAAAAWLMRRQWRWRRQLWQAHGQWRSPAGQSPATWGVWRPVVVLPADFETRFSDAEQQLIWRHERVHVRRKDNLWTWLALSAWMALWWQPLAWHALSRFRLDQEMACDEAVLSPTGSEPISPRFYLETLMKSHLAQPEALAAAWGMAHPMLERARQLLARPASSLARRSAQLTVGLCAGALVVASHAVPVSAPSGEPASAKGAVTPGPAPTSDSASAPAPASAPVSPQQLPATASSTKGPQAAPRADSPATPSGTSAPAAGPVQPAQAVKAAAQAGAMPAASAVALSAAPAKAGPVQGAQAPAAAQAPLSQPLQLQVRTRLKGQAFREATLLTLQGAPSTYSQQPLNLADAQERPWMDLMVATEAVRDQTAQFKMHVVLNYPSEGKMQRMVSSPSLQLRHGQTLTVKINEEVEMQVTLTML